VRARSGLRDSLGARISPPLLYSPDGRSPPDRGSAAGLSDIWIVDQIDQSNEQALNQLRLAFNVLLYYLHASVTLVCASLFLDW
jgi:hypothetical protein